MYEGSNQKQEGPALPMPEDVGFHRVKGLDYFEGVDVAGLPEGQRKMAGMSIDNTAERRGKFEQMLANIAAVGTNPETRKKAVDALNEMSRAALEGGVDDEHLSDMMNVIDFARGAIGSFSDARQLRMILERGSRDAMQESIARTSELLLTNAERHKIDEPSHTSLDQPVMGVLELARQLYAQEHGGNAYRTAEQKQELEKMKQQAKQIHVE